MYRKDYIDKQIEELGRVLAKLLSDLVGKKETAQSDTATNAVLKHLGLCVDDLIALPDQTLIDTLLATQQFDAANLEKMADVLELLAYSDVQKSNTLLRKSLMIYQYIDVSEKVFSVERNAKINRIRKILEP